MQACKWSERADDEQQARRIERHHQHAERANRTNAEAAHRERHRAECADGRKPHDHREDAKQHVRDAVDEFLYPAPGALVGVQCEAKQKGEQQDR